MAKKKERVRPKWLEVKDGSGNVVAFGRLDKDDHPGMTITEHDGPQQSVVDAHKAWANADVIAFNAIDPNNPPADIIKQLILKAQGK